MYWSICLHRHSRTQSEKDNRLTTRRVPFVCLSIYKIHSICLPICSGCIGIFCLLLFLISLTTQHFHKHAVEQQYNCCSASSSILLLLLLPFYICSKKTYFTLKRFFIIFHSYGMCLCTTHTNKFLCNFLVSCVWFKVQCTENGNLSLYVFVSHILLYVLSCVVCWLCSLSPFYFVPFSWRDQFKHCANLLSISIRSKQPDKKNWLRLTIFLPLLSIKVSRLTQKTKSFFVYLFDVDMTADTLTRLMYEKKRGSISSNQKKRKMPKPRFGKFFVSLSSSATAMIKTRSKRKRCKINVFAFLSTDFFRRLFLMIPPMI